MPGNFHIIIGDQPVPFKTSSTHSLLPMPKAPGLKPQAKNFEQTAMNGITAPVSVRDSVKFLQWKCPRERSVSPGYAGHENASLIGHFHSLGDHDAADFVFFQPLNRPDPVFILHRLQVARFGAADYLHAIRMNASGGADEGHAQLLNSRGADFVFQIFMALQNFKVQIQRGLRDKLPHRSEPGASGSFH
jgi:hypothetical protein